MFVTAVCLLFLLKYSCVHMLVVKGTAWPRRFILNGVNCNSLINVDVPVVQISLPIIRQILKIHIDHIVTYM